MSADETLARRADQIVEDFHRSERQKRYDAFEELGKLVDDGQMTWEQVFAIQRKLGPTAVLATYSVNPAIQGNVINKLERSIDGAEGGQV